MTQPSSEEEPQIELAAAPGAVETYLAGLSPSSRRRMLGALRRAAKVLGIDDYESYRWRGLNHAQVARVREQLVADGAAPVTINVVLSALRGVVRAALHPDPASLTRDEVERLGAVREARNAPVERHTAPGRALAQAEVSALIATCMKDRTAMGARDAAMVLSLYSTGMTCRELVDLAPGDFALDPPSLTINAGTGRARRVLLGRKTAETVAAWLAIRGRRAWGRLFVPLGAVHLIEGERLTRRMVSQVIERRAREAALSPIVAEDLRHAAIRELFDMGAGVRLVRSIVGSVGHDTLSRYAPRPPADYLYTEHPRAKAPRHKETPYHRW